MHGAALEGAPGQGGGHRVRQPLEAIGHHHAHRVQPPGPRPLEHLGPAPRALGGAAPDAQHPAAPVREHAQRHVEGLRRHRPAPGHPGVEAVDVEDRHPGRERPGQPGLHVRRGGLQHPRRAAGGVGAPVEVAQGRADVPGGHPAGVEPRDDALLGLVLQAQELQQERAEQAPTVAGDAHRVARAPDVHGPGAVPVALVAPLGVRREPLAPLVAHQAVEHELPEALLPDSIAAELAQYLKNRFLCHRNTG